MSQSPSRREFLKASAAAGAALAAPALQTAPCPGQPPPRNALPRWRGFNLTNFFQALDRGERGRGVLNEDDLRWMRDWGFDFVRLPMDYWLWIDSDWRRTRSLKPDDAFQINQAALEKVDRAIDLCRKYGLHACVNFHRAPGYCINNPEREPFVLWRDRRAEDAFLLHWETFAKRYQGVPREALSFNLVNEAPRPRPGYMTRQDYARIMTRAADKIREYSPDRWIIADGLSVGREVAAELIPAGLAQSVHGYWPGGISHYRAPWVDRKSSFPTPTWPLRNKEGKVTADRKKLEELYEPWGQLVRRGIGVHCGECGCYNKTPYPVFIAWFQDVMDILQGHGIGYALWNFRGAFGILDSGRKDIQYESWRGHQLDRRLLAILQAH